MAEDGSSGSGREEKGNNCREATREEERPGGVSRSGKTRRRVR